MRTEPSCSPSGVIRTITLRRRCRSDPDVLATVVIFVHRGLPQRDVVSTPEHPLGTTKGGGPALSSHQAARMCGWSFLVGRWSRSMAQSTLTRRRARASTAWLCRLPSARLRVVVGLGGGASLDADHGRGVEDALELAVVALRPVQVAGAVARSRGAWARVRRSRRGDRRRRTRPGSRRRRRGTPRRAGRRCRPCW